MLNFLYENQPKCENFIPRKLLLDGDKILLFGPLLSGKTTLGLNWLNNYINSFYIDTSDLRFKLDFTQLCEFVKQKNIKAICLDNITKVPEILPKCEKILLISRQKNLQAAGFKKQNLFGLDFEEFIAFSKNNTESTLFSHFMSSGNSLPINKDESFFRYSIFASISKTAGEILSTKAFYEGVNFSALSVFKELKENMKISKDFFYKEIQNLYDIGIIDFCYNFEQNSRMKKMYFCDFALRKFFTLNKNPRKIIENMIFCELAKSGENVYFWGEFDFYLPRLKTAILVLPFLSSELAFLKAKKLANHEINEIIIISNTEQKTQVADGTKVRFMDFMTFAAGYLE